MWNWVSGWGRGGGHSPGLLYYVLEEEEGSGGVGGGSGHTWPDDPTSDWLLPVTRGLEA